VKLPRAGKIATPFIQDNHEYVKLFDKNVKVGELVLLGFHGWPKKSQTIMHINGDKRNNSLNNLAWKMYDYDIYNTQMDDIDYYIKIPIAVDRGLRHPIVILENAGEVAKFVNATSKMLFEYHQSELKKNELHVKNVVHRKLFAKTPDDTDEEERKVLNRVRLYLKWEFEDLKTDTENIDQVIDVIFRQLKFKDGGFIAGFLEEIFGYGIYHHFTYHLTCGWKLHQYTEKAIVIAAIQRKILPFGFNFYFCDTPLYKELLKTYGVGNWGVNPNFNLTAHVLRRYKKEPISNTYGQFGKFGAYYIHKEYDFEKLLPNGNFVQLDWIDILKIRKRHGFGREEDYVCLLDIEEEEQEKQEKKQEEELAQEEEQEGNHDQSPKRCIAIEVSENDGDTWMKFDSIKEASEQLRMNRKRLGTMLKNNIAFNGYIVRHYLTETEEEELKDYIDEEWKPITRDDIHDLSDAKALVKRRRDMLFSIKKKRENEEKEKIKNRKQLLNEAQEIEKTIKKKAKELERGYAKKAIIRKKEERERKRREEEHFKQFKDEFKQERQ
jgi:hypothetical protein